MSRQVVKTEDELRALVEARAGVRLDPSVWAFLKQRGYIDLALSSAAQGEDEDFYGDLDDMVAVVSDLLKLLAEYGTGAGDTTDYADQRGRVERLLTKLDTDSEPTGGSASLGTLVRAILVERLAPVVAEFRARWLGGKVLTREEARVWLEEQSRAPQELKVRLENDLLFWDDDFHFFEFRVVHIKQSRALHELVDLAKDLQARFGCNILYAVDFVLCGIIPPVPISREFFAPKTPCVPFVTVRVPLWMQPDEVAKIYKGAWEPKPVKRFRPPSRRMAISVSELVKGKLRGESLTQVAERLGVRRNLLSEWYRRARIIANRILNGIYVEEENSHEDDET